MALPYQLAMNNKLVLLPLAAMIGAANAQIGTGTIIVFGQSQDRFVIAADSRVTFDHQPPDDSRCKIAAFKANHVVFAASGANGFINDGSHVLKTWLVSEIAKDVVTEAWSDPVPADATEAANRLAIAWEGKTIEHWQQTRLMEPILFAKMVGENKDPSGAITNGIFAIAYKGRLAWVGSSVIFQNGEFTIKHPDNTCSNGVDMCTSGEVATLSTYFLNAPPDHGDQLSFALRLANLAADGDSTGTIHGPIDALELLADGSINWKQKKDGCPDSQD